MDHTYLIRQTDKNALAIADPNGKSFKDQPVRNLTEISTFEKEKKKKNHTHKTIFTWFGNLPTSTELQGFHYYQRRVQKCDYKIFSLTQKTRQQPYKTLITKVGPSLRSMD